MIPSSKSKRSSNDDEERKKGSNASSSNKKYKGVMQMKKGNWASQITRPKEKRKIWLGTYDSAEKAARAYDAAAVCLRGFQSKVLRNLHFPESLPEIRNSDDQPFSDEEIKTIARRHAVGANTGPVKPALGTGEPSNEREVEHENGNDDPIDWSFMDENQDDNSIDWSLVDALASQVLPLQAGLDYSGYGFLPPSESAPEHQMTGELNFPDPPLEIPNSSDQPFSDDQIREIVRQPENGANTGPVQPTLGTGEPSNGREVEAEKGNNDPIDWSFMDENRNDNSFDWSLVDARVSPVLPRQAGLDFSGYDFLPLSESAPEHQVLDNAEEEVRLWNFSD